MSDVIPCPFCGNNPFTREVDSEIRVYDSTLFGCPMSPGWTTLEKWNTRPREDALQAKIDDLLKACEALVDYRDTIDILSLKMVNHYIKNIRTAIDKARGKK